MSTPRRAALLAALALAGCTPVASFFNCTDNMQCALAGRDGGRCESNGICSFPDSLCSPSGRRYRAGCGDACVGGGANRLHGLHPEAAAPGDTVFLEGSFGDGDLHVILPTASGDRSVVPTRVGARLSVKLPDNVVRGTVRVSSDTCPSDRLPLEVVPRNATLGTFTELTQNLPSEGHAVVNTGKLLLSFGSSDAMEVDVAEIKSDGTLGDFGAVNFVTLNFAHHRGCALFLGDRILVIGGNSGGLVVREVEELLLSDYPRAFRKTGRLLKIGRQGHQCAAIGPWIYVIGGRPNEPPNGNATTSIERARIVDGQLGDFEDAGVTVQPRGDFGLVVAGERVHLFGGASDNTSSSKEQRGELASINADGSLGPFTQRTDDSFNVPTFSAPILLEFGTVVVSRDIYLFGGFSAGNYLNTVMNAPLASGDDITPFTLSSIKLAQVRLFSSALVVGGRVWVFGGENRSSIESAPLLP